MGALLLLPVTAAQAQEKLTLERVFASPDLAGPQPRALKLSPDGKLVTLLKPRADEKERLDLWAIDTATGASTGTGKRAAPRFSGRLSPLATVDATATGAIAPPPRTT